MKDPTNWIKRKERKQHQKQRAKRGFSKFDYWNFDSYISFVIIGACEEFKTGNGYPNRVGSMEAWIYILDEIIDGYTAHLQLQELDMPKDVLYGDWAKGLHERYKTSALLFAEYMPEMWD